MSEAERAESVRQKKRCDRKISGYALRRMWRIFLPFYNPRRLSTPPLLQEALDEYARIAQQAQPLTA